MSYLQQIVAPYYRRPEVTPLQTVNPTAEMAKNLMAQALSMKMGAGSPALPVASKGNYVSWGGATLSADAMRSFMSVAARFGGIPLTSSYRSIAQQAKLYADYLAGRHKAQVAPPGKSLHNFGLAIDVNTAWLKKNPGAVKALLAAGWRQFDPVNEPWHFSYGTTG